MRLWRLTRAGRTALDGAGTSKHGGRYSPPGVPVVSFSSEPGEKLVFTWGAVGGWPDVDPDRLDDSPLVTVTLKESGGRTRMTVHVELPAAFATAQMPAGFLDHVETGWRETVDRLVAEVAGLPA